MRPAETDSMAEGNSSNGRGDPGLDDVNRHARGWALLLLIRCNWVIEALFALLEA